MSRSGKTPKRIVLPDPVYQNRLLSRFINCLMKSGKKTAAEKVAYGALDIIKSKGLDPVQTLEAAVSGVGPRLEVRPRRVGGASYQVPTEVRGDRRTALAIRWIIDAARKKQNKEFKTFGQKLAQELIDATNNTGLAIKKREDTLRMAEANKAFAHFRW